MYTKQTTKTIFILVLAALVAATLVAPFASASPAPNPSKTPRMVTVTFWGTDGTQMSFNWNTTDYCDSDVWVVEASDVLGFASPSVIKTKGQFHQSQASKADGYIHTCVVSNLKLGTKYLYKVGDEELNAWCETGSFTTESGKLDKFSFIHVSDPQSDEEHYYDIYRQVLQAAGIQANPSFVVNTGDIVNNSWRGRIPILQQWEWGLTGTFSVMKDYPIVATTGNHEAASYDFSSRFNFDIPQGASTENGVYYSFNYNTVHFVAINTNDTLGTSDAASASGLSDAQMQWIESDLEANKNAPWKVAIMHKAIYDGSEGANNTDGSNYDINYIRKQLAPLFTKYGVDLVLQGHDHMYSRTYPLAVSLNANGDLDEAATSRETSLIKYNGVDHDFYTNPNGTIYINSGSASAWKLSVTVDYDKNVIEQAETGVLMYSSITIDGDKLLIEWFAPDAQFNSIPYRSIGILKTQPNVPQIPDENDVPQTPEDKEPLSVGAIIGISVGGAVLLAGAAVAIVFAVKHKKK